MMQRLALTASVLGLALAACSSSVDDTASLESANTEGRPLTAISGREWARCWFDIEGADAKLSCTSTAANGDPLDTSLEVTAATMSSANGFHSASKTLDLREGGSVVVGTFPRSAFPVLVMMHATSSLESARAIGATRGLDLWHKPKVTRAEDLPASRPAVMTQPFDLWPVGFVDATAEGRGGFVVSTKYEVPIAPYATFLDETTLPLDRTVLGRDVAGAIQYFVAPKSGAIDLTVGPSNASTTAALERPGYYAITPTGMRPATPEEIAQAFPRGGDTPPDGRPSPDGEPRPDGEPEPEPPTDGDPTCGGPGQARCAGGACDDGTRFDSTRYTCVACGDHGQTYCLSGEDNASGSKRCNDGTRFDSTRYTCVTCGGAGQTYCLSGDDNASGSKRCNDGTRFDSTRYTCVACGGAGQTYCLSGDDNASGSQVCDAGLRVSSGRCVQ